MNKYRASLRMKPSNAHEALARWEFGKALAEGEKNEEDERARRYKDFVLLQTLSSQLRSRLTSDLRSRKGPGGQLF